MKAWGVFLICVGVVWMLVAFNLDTSVAAGGYVGVSRVENIGLIAQRQNHLLVSSLVTLIGSLMTIFGRTTEPTAPLSTPESTPEVPPCERDLSLDAYRLWLASRYNVTRNEIFERFVYENQTFGSLDEALAKAHEEEVVRAERQKTEEAEHRAESELEALKKFEFDQKMDKILKQGSIAALAGLVMATPFVIWHFENERQRVQIEREKNETLAAERAEVWGLKIPTGWNFLRMAEVDDRSDSNSVWCNSTTGFLIEFEVDDDAQKVTETVTTAVGPGTDPYAGLESGESDMNETRNYELKSGRSLHLSAFGGPSSTQVYLCETDATQ